MWWVVGALLTLVVLLCCCFVVVFFAGMIKGGKSHEMLTTSNFSFVPVSSRFGPHWLDIQLATTPRGIQRRSVHRWLPSNDGVLHVSAMLNLLLACQKNPILACMYVFDLFI